MKQCHFILVISISCLLTHTAHALIIQERETGFCHIDGTIQSNVDGYTGNGYADSDRGVGKSISWGAYTDANGPCLISWRYANGGGSGDRPATLVINGVVVKESIPFPYTGNWSNWVNSEPLTINLTEGDNAIMIEAHSPDGLANIDYMMIEGNGLTPANVPLFYRLKVNQNDISGGTVSHEPVLAYYKHGTIVTLSAHPKPGYLFQSWSEDVTSSDPNTTFEILGHTVTTAIFLPEGIKVDPNLVGYATVQDDRGTPYWVIGGMLGETVDVNSVEGLHTYLESPQPNIVRVSEKIAGSDVVEITSHKTLIGITDSAHLQGIELKINKARNVIIQNLKVSHVTPGDAILINGRSRNIWIDHCELFSDQNHGKDYYDGLLDIKNESSYITVSWCAFHDHFKTCLISSNDESRSDHVIRVTFHHNFFSRCSSRLPSIRFGKAHLFNNYYLDCDTAVNSRMEACVRMENNYFEDVRVAVMTAYSSIPGGVQLIDNHFGNSRVSTSPLCELDVPYDYNICMNDINDVNDIPLLILEKMDTLTINTDYPSVR